MKTKYTLSLLLLGVLCFTAFKIDDDPFSLLLKKMETYNKENPQEKVHLHLDKPFYAIGDDIWFKAYLLNTLTGRPSVLSENLYVELIDESDAVKKQLNLPLAGGVTWGDFQLADSLAEGNYRIRAYTQWMRNAGTEFFYDKTIKVGNAWANAVFTSASYTYNTTQEEQQVSSTIRFRDKKNLPYAGNEVSYTVQLDHKTVEKGKATTNNAGEINITFPNTSKETGQAGKITATINLPNKQKVTKNIPITAASTAIDVQFFPEGGSMIEQLPTKLGIKATAGNGSGKDVSGSIVNAKGDEITQFKTDYLGMGSFIINPQPGEAYSAIVKYPDGATKKIALPAAQPSGYQLALHKTDESSVLIKILMSENLINKGELKLVAQHQGEIYASTPVKTNKQIAIINIAKDDLPSGIIQFTLFDTENKPVAERLVFVRNPINSMGMTVSRNKKEYKVREKVSLELKATAQSLPSPGSFSVAVTNSSVVNPDLDNESHIFSTLLLTSDLPGYIEKPNHYFQDDSPTTQLHLDNLMLTQGWRRFLWKNVIAGTAPIVRFQPEKGLSISGTLLTLGGKPIVGGKVSLFSSSGGLLAVDTLSDANGRFVFDQMSFGDSTKFVVQGRNGKNRKNAEVKLDIVPGQVVTFNKNTGDIEVNVNESIASYIRESDNYFDELMKRGLLQRTQVLDQVNIVATKNPAKNSRNLNGAGRADAVITAEQLGICNNLIMCLQGRVAGLIVRNGIPYLTRSGSQTPMSIVIDGMHVEPDFLDMMNPQDVESIEVLKSIGNTAIYGSRGAGGVLIITTKTGDGIRASRYTPDIITHTPKGYSYSRQFYVPKYDTANNNSAPDLRTTIHWQPQVITDSTGTARIDYFNADTKGTYRVVIEGINVLGNLGRTVYTYEVK